MKQNVTQNVINGDMGNIYASRSVGVLLTVTPLLYSTGCQVDKTNQASSELEQL